jgi:hypothetical protein
MPDQQPSQPPPPEAQPLVCAHCRNPLGGYYEIKHVHPDGHASPKLVRTCSIICIIQWAYHYGIGRGLQGLFAVKGIIDKIRGQQP